MTIWAEDMETVSDAVDEVCGGEAFEFRPMRQLTVNDPPEEDPDRSIRTVTGILSAPASDHEVAVGRPTRTHVLGGDGSGRFTMQTVSLSCDERQFVVGQFPRQMDKMKRDGTGILYSIEDVQPDGQGRMVMVLAHLGPDA